MSTDVDHGDCEGASSLVKGLIKQALSVHHCKRTGMENLSLINKRWLLCYSASFPGLIILAVYLYHGQQPTPLTSLEYFETKLAGSITIVHGGMDSELQKLDVETGPGEEKCNIFYGRWVYDSKAYPLYHGKQCPFFSEQVNCQNNGRPDSDYENWRWKPKNCQIPRFNGTNMLERLRGKRVIIVGDSLNRNQWESLSCLLYSVLPPSRTYINVKGARYKVFRAEDYNCTVEFFWSPFLVELDQRRPKRRVLKLETLSTSAQRWQGADIMVFNTGHWWLHHGKLKAWDFFEHDGKLIDNLPEETAYEIAMKTWARWIDHNVDPTKTTIFFRSISPEHKMGDSWCHNQTKPIMDESYEGSFPRRIIAIAEQTLEEMATVVHYLNITKLSEYRKDAHSTVYTVKQGKTLNEEQQKNPRKYTDCSHWCLPGVPDTWNELIYASIVLEYSKGSL